MKGLKIITLASLVSIWSMNLDCSLNVLVKPKEEIKGIYYSAHPGYYMEGSFPVENSARTYINLSASYLGSIYKALKGINKKDEILTLQEIDEMLNDNDIPSREELTEKVCRWADTRFGNKNGKIELNEAELLYNKIVEAISKVG